VLLVGLKLFAVVAAVWTAFIVIDMFIGLLLKKAAKTETKFDDLLIPLVSKSLKALAVCVGVLTGADALNLPLAGLVGGLGIGGLALAMASKDAVSNLFGSFTVLVDRPFEVGDWVITPGAEGTVEAVGFRSTRIRTFYNSQITVPNSLLTTAMVDNMGRRRYRRVKTTLGVQYNTTPAQMDAFCEGVRELIRRNPYTRKDYYHVYFNEFGSSSLDVMLYCFLECPDWAIELRERHRLLLDILRLADRLGVQFAFPTRTMHLFQEDTPSAPPELSDPAAAGKELAAQLASEAASRPGPVEF
jgi:MscS family membrane protein